MRNAENQVSIPAFDHRTATSARRRQRERRRMVSNSGSGGESSIFHPSGGGGACAWSSIGARTKNPRGDTPPAFGGKYYRGSPLAAIYPHALGSEETEGAVYLARNGVEPVVYRRPFVARRPAPGVACVTGLGCITQMPFCVGHKLGPYEIVSAKRKNDAVRSAVHVLKWATWSSGPVRRASQAERPQSRITLRG